MVDEPVAPKAVERDRLERLVADCDHDISFVRELFDDFTHESRRRLSSLRRGIEREDAFRALHKWAAAARTLGLVELAELAGRLEDRVEMDAELGVEELDELEEALGRSQRAWGDEIAHLESAG
jgi:HPt (histidine-containing phosphotransfer) domain-containing protein